LPFKRNLQRYNEAGAGVKVVQLHLLLFILFVVVNPPELDGKWRAFVSLELPSFCFRRLLLSQSNVRRACVVLYRVCRYDLATDLWPMLETQPRWGDARWNQVDP
jgi:hypothetical protein